MTADALCWMDGDILPAADARVSVFDHGLLYGDGIFEGIRYYHRRPFLLGAHLRRLAESAAAIGLALPYDATGFEQAIDWLIERRGDDSGYLRLVVTRGPGSLGIDPRSCARPVAFIIADGLRVMDATAIERGVSLHVAETRRMPAACLDPRIKSLNYLNNILARIEANRAGADEALMLNLDGKVCEGSVDNLFVVSDGCLRTPPLSDGMLAGITRDVILALARDLKITIDESSLTLDEVLAADECFLSGTGAELIPVSRIGERQLPRPAKAFFPRLREAFQAYIERECRH